MSLNCQTVKENRWCVNYFSQSNSLQRKLLQCIHY